MSNRQATPFRFDAARHEYTDADGRVLPHITEMLERTGWIDSTWYNDEASERGRQVHRLSADFDMGALDMATCPHTYKPWLLAYQKAIGLLQLPMWDAIEAPAVHPHFQFGGRPDRVGKVFQIQTIMELKTNNKGWNLEKAHPIQTALQAVLASATRSLPAEAWQRLALYCRPDGRCRVYEHTERRKDFDEAYRIIKVCCR